MITVKQAEVLNYDALLELWAEQYIETYKKLPEAHIKFRTKIDLMNEINKLDKQKQNEESEYAQRNL